MAWHNTTGYKPDPVLAKQMSGGGAGALFSALGGGFNKMYQDIESKQRWKEEQKLKERQAETAESFASSNLMNSNINREKHEKGIVDEINSQYSRMVGQNNLLAKHGDATHGYGAVMPSFDEFNSMRPQDRTAFAAQWDSLTGGIGDRMATERANAERHQKLADDELKHLRKLEEINYGQKAKTTKPVVESITTKSGRSLQAYQNENGLWFDVETGERITEPFTKFTPPDEAKDLLLEGKRREADSAITQQLSDIMNEFESTWGGGTLLNIGGDKNALKRDAEKEIYKMLQNGEFRGMSNIEIAREGFRRAGGNAGAFGVSITDEKRQQNYLNSVINGADERLITPENVAAFWDTQGKSFDSETIEMLTKMHKLEARSKAEKAGSVAEFNRRNKLNSGFFERFIDGVKDDGSKVMNWLGEKGLLSPGDSKRWRERANNPTGGGSNFAVANQQMDWAPIAVEVLKYSPTIGLSPVALGGRLTTIAANAAKFGSADAALAEIYGDNIPLVGGAAAAAGGLVGMFTKLGIPLEKGSKAESVYRQFQKTMDETYNKGDHLGKPTYQRR